jgi:hypothetical protein
MAIRAPHTLAHSKAKYKEPLVGLLLLFDDLLTEIQAFIADINVL